ncbi:hypothetical protein KR51_00022910 [Rubidibacter lacunae KORDI 51-2]|uniref:Uncharacterized protein n=1 Tax=Rubidibacter lacunae KORDI 51-2 TaxID=582515 RepID=U5DKD3_9CHRO|nr:hypothetical protein KR51_00022910 [Rubidibacter lacunae KORDI 51-2]
MIAVAAVGRIQEAPKLRQQMLLDVLPSWSWSPHDAVFSEVLSVNQFLFTFHLQTGELRPGWYVPIKLHLIITTH